mgnify:CR=1 FL=1
MATVSELSMFQATAMKLQQEKHDRQLEYEESLWNFENSRAPNTRCEQEWFRMEATVESDKITAKLPKGSTHYLFNLIDDKNFLISYPRMGQMKHFNKGNYSTKAFKVKTRKK